MNEREQAEYYEWEAYQRLCGVCHRDLDHREPCAKFEPQGDGVCNCGHDEECHVGKETP